MSPENEYEREGARDMPIKSAQAAGLEGIDQPEPDFDPEIDEEVRLQEETREAEGDEGDEEVETVLNFRDDEDD
jgi:hypothetical protein